MLNYFSKTLISIIFIFQWVLSYAVIIDLHIFNQIDDHDDPIKLKSISFSEGTVNVLSSNIGEPIGGKLLLTVDMPQHLGATYIEYKDDLNKTDDSFNTIVLGNNNKEIKLHVFYGITVFLYPYMLNNINTYRPNNPYKHNGIIIY